MALSPDLAPVLGIDGPLHEGDAFLEHHSDGTGSAEFVSVGSAGFLCSQAIDPSRLSDCSSDCLNQGRDHSDVSQTYGHTHREGETRTRTAPRRGAGDY